MEFKKLPEDSKDRRNNLIALYFLRGKYKETEKLILQRPVIQDHLAGFRLRTENPEEALKELDKVWNHAAQSEDLTGQIQILYAKGLAYLLKQSIADALRAAEEIQELAAKGMRQRNIRFYYHLRGLIELEREKFSKAISFLSKAKDLLYAPNENFPEYNPLFVYTLAEAFYRANKLDKAQREYEYVISLALGCWQSGDFYAKSLYMLGKIFEEIGKKQKAIEHFEKFLDFWKDADPGLPEVEDAKRRLSGLQKS